MKTNHFMTVFTALLLLLTGNIHAQDNTKTAAKKQISNSSGQADWLQGKKLQQQSLTNDFEKLASVDTTISVKKKTLKKYPRSTH